MIEAVLQEILTKLEQIEARLERIEVRSVVYEGIWESSRTYPAGSACTHAGSLWITAEATDQKPGNGATAWKLAVKRGSIEAAPSAKRVATQPRSISPWGNGSGRRF